MSRLCPLAIWAAHFPLYECEHCPVTFCACPSGCQTLMSNAFGALDEGPWGREQLLSLCQTVKLMVPPPCLPEQITNLPIISEEMSVQGQLFTDVPDEATVFVLRSLNPHRVTPAMFCPPSPLVCLWLVFTMFLQFTTPVETLIGKYMAMGILPHSTSLSACLPGWKPQTCLKDGETCRCVNGSRTRRRPATSSKHYSVSADEMYIWMFFYSLPLFLKCIWCFKPVFSLGS